MIATAKLKKAVREGSYSLTKFPRIFEAPRLIAFGAGNAFLGLQATVELPFCAVVDDTPGYAGRTIAGLEVMPSECLAAENKDELFVIICANTLEAIKHMSAKLRSLGMVYGRDFTDCSLLHQVTISIRLEERLGVLSNENSFSLIHALSRALSIPNMSTISGTWLFAELLESIPAIVKGAVAECGVYKGANSLAALCASPQLRTRRYQLFDSFEGFAVLSDNDPKSRSEEFRDTSFTSIQETFAVFQNVDVIKGYFETTLPNLVSEDYVMAYIDCDLELPARFCFEYFWDKIQPGGYVLVHDYWFPEEAERLPGRDNWGGIKRAVDSFFTMPDLETVVFPETAHIAIRKSLG
jgi:hypothetical protein